MSRKKIYYPEGQIQKGLYTDGGEWMFEDGTEYVGDYHKYTTGEVYTKSVFVKNVSKQLITYINLSKSDSKVKFQYDNLRDGDVESFVFAKYEKNQPTQKDYDRGYYSRYFVKRHFDQIIAEVNKDTFNSVQDEHYSKLEIAWKLRGNVVDINLLQVRTAEKDIKGISNYITNYSEFVKL